MFTLRILFLLFILSSMYSCTSKVQEEIPWHGIQRALRYHPEGEDFVIRNGERRFNRALYGSNTGFRVEAGDLPEFALYLPGMGGNMKLGIGNADSSIWLIEAADIMARYRPGSMIYTIQDPFLGKGSIHLHILAMYDREGMILRVFPNDIPDGINMFWAFGGATGKRFSRDGDIGADPESSFYLKPEYCRDNEFDIDDNSFTLYYGSGRVRTEAERYENNYTPSEAEIRESMLRDKKRITGLVPPGGEIRISDARKQASPEGLFRSERQEAGLVSGKRILADTQEMYFLLSAGEMNLAYDQAAGLFEEAEKSRKQIAGRIRLHTPDPYLNTLGPALGIAADAIWEAPSYLHGSVAWRMRLNGWRGAYTADWLGWHERARMHLEGYCKAQYTSPESGPNVPDPKTNLARQEEKAGNSIFTSGYISRYPNRIYKPHHYDMNLVFIDQLLWHFNWTGDLDFAAEIWPVIERHLAWEKRCFDADGDGLYDAYCCIWPSDALQYSGGGVTHSSAYNYDGNLLGGRLAERIGKDPSPYYREAERIKASVDAMLWMPERGWYAEYKDKLGLGLIHPSAAIWTIYHALDSELPDPFQAYQSLRYIDTEIPRIPIIAEGLPEGDFHTLATSTWMPYTWSINNVALPENLHVSLAYWQGGRHEEAFSLWKSLLLESMYLGASPGNFQQLSFYDAFRGELYRDFADPIGMTSRTLVEGLFGIHPDALEKTLQIRPGFPAEWDYASLETPDIKVDFKRYGDKDTYIIIPDFPVEMDLRLMLPARRTGIGSVLINGQEGTWKNQEGSVGKPSIEISASYADTLRIAVEWKGDQPEQPMMNESVALGDRIELNCNKAIISEIYDPQKAISETELSGQSLSFRVAGLKGHRTVFIKLRQDELIWWAPLDFEIREKLEFIPSLPSSQGEIRFRVANNSLDEIRGVLGTGGHIFAELDIPPHGITREFTAPSEYILPGSNQVEFKTNDKVYRRHFVNWNIAADPDTPWETIDISEYYNDLVTSIFTNSYLTPRSESPTLQLPVQGIGDWCSYSKTAIIDDSGLRAWAGSANRIILDQGIPFETPGKEGLPNILFTSRWDNYPARASIPLSGKASHAYFLMAGSAHHMQSRMTNGIIRVGYADGSEELLELVHPDTWWPIEQDYYTDGYAFRIDAPKPPRIYLKSGEQQKEDYAVLRKNGTNDIDGGAATVYDLPLDPGKELQELTLETLCNDVVIGLMGVTLRR
jgi:hypothetical protein